MKFSALLTGALFGLASFSSTYAAKSFSASNLYYAAGLKEAQQTALFEGLQSAGVKVLRVWLDGKAEPQFSYTITDKIFRPVPDDQRHSYRSLSSSSRQFPISLE